MLFCLAFNIAWPPVDWNLDCIQFLQRWQIVFLIQLRENPDSNSIGKAVSLVDGVFLGIDSTYLMVMSAVHSASDSETESTSLCLFTVHNVRKELQVWLTLSHLWWSRSERVTRCLRTRRQRRLNSLLTSDRLRPPQTKGVSPVADTGEIDLNTNCVIPTYGFRRCLVISLQRMFEPFLSG